MVVAVGLVGVELLLLLVVVMLVTEVVAVELDGVDVVAVEFEGVDVVAVELVVVSDNVTMSGDDGGETNPIPAQSKAKK